MKGFQVTSDMSWFFITNEGEEIQTKKSLKSTWHLGNEIAHTIKYMVGKTKNAPSSNSMGCASLHTIAQNKKEPHEQ